VASCHSIFGIPKNSKLAELPPTRKAAATTTTVATATATTAEATTATTAEATTATTATEATTMAAAMTTTTTKTSSGGECQRKGKKKETPMELLVEGLRDTTPDDFNFMVEGQLQDYVAAIMETEPTMGHFLSSRERATAGAVSPQNLSQLTNARAAGGPRALERKGR
jgi:hypothetical protein